MAAVVTVPSVLSERIVDGLALAVCMCLTAEVESVWIDPANGGQSRIHDHRMQGPCICVNTSSDCTDSTISGLDLKSDIVCWQK